MRATSRLTKHFLPYFFPKILVCSALFLITTQLFIAQNIPYKSLSFEKVETEDGLTHTFINTIAQDSAGFLWIGTQVGLFRFDGYNYSFYTNSPDDSTSIDNQRIETIYVSYNGDMWVGTRNGLNLYLPESDNFRRIKYDPGGRMQLGPGQVNDITEDKDGNIWFVTQSGGLIQFSLKHNTASRFLGDSTSAIHIVHEHGRVLLIDRDENIWVGTGDPFHTHRPGGGLYRIDAQTGKTKKYVHKPDDTRSLKSDYITALFQDRLGRIWVGTGRAQLHLYNREDDSFIRKSDHGDIHAAYASAAPWSATPHVRFIHEDKSGYFWIGTFGGGLNVYDPFQKETYAYRSAPTDQHSLSNELLWAFLEDSQGRMWIGNTISGLHKVDPATRKFDVIKAHPGMNHSISGNTVSGLAASRLSDSIVWIPTKSSGLNKFNIKSGENLRYHHDPQNSNSLSSDRVWSVHMDYEHNLWVGTENGLDKLIPGTQHFKHFKHRPNDPNSLSSNSITKILRTQDGNLWLGTWNEGLNRWNLKTNDIDRFNFLYDSHASYENSVYVIHEDKEGTLWTATWIGGLYKFNNATQQFDEIPQFHGIGANFLYEDTEARFWIGTNDRGLICYLPESDSIVASIDMNTGLSSNCVYGILPDTHGDLWLSTNNGLNRIEMESGNISHYKRTDGLPSNIFSYMAADITIDDVLLFGTNNGVVYFDQYITENTEPPIPVIERIRILDRRQNVKEHIIKVGSHKEQPGLELSYNQRDIVIEFLGLHYTNPSKNTYRYRLEPYEQEWNNVGTQRNARYTNLGSGSYTFYVESANSDGYWSVSPASVSFSVRPPWWGSTLAFILYIAIGFLMLWVIYRIVIDRERQQNEFRLKAAEAAQLKKVDQIKSRFFANVSHEFRTPLTLIEGPIRSLIDGQFSGERQQQYALILRNTRRLRRLIDQLLDLSRIESNSVQLHLEPTDLVGLARETCGAYAGLAASRNIQFQFQGPVSEITIEADIEKLKKIISNLLSNAFKFTHSGGKIDVEISNNDRENGICIHVSDTGIGIAPDHLSKVFDRFYQVDSSERRQYEGSGIGLSVVKEYVEMHKGHIQVESTPGQGSDFTVVLPTELLISPITSTGIVEQIGMGHNGPAMATDVKGNGDVAKPNAPLILVVEDNRDMQEFMYHCLGNDFNIVCADNGVQGLRFAIEHIPDMIITDIMMPELDGFGLCKALREEPKTCHIPIIILTALAEAKDRMAGLTHGAEAYLTKPFDAGELLIRVNKLIEQRKVLQGKYQQDTVLRPAVIAQTNMDEEFLGAFINVVDRHLDDPDISLEDISRAMNMSRSQLYRKFKALTGETASVFIRKYRLNRAAQYLEDSGRNISEVGYAVGFATHSHFTKSFKDQYGMTPTEYQEAMQD